jgi:hypothetical protein
VQIYGKKSIPANSVVPEGVLMCTVFARFDICIFNYLIVKTFF